jgi:hypothetical protein
MICVSLHKPSGSRHLEYYDKVKDILRALDLLIGNVE